ncbi:MAG: flagellar basal body rod protein FlgB [candidate division KSB1 bacterium]|nr:flagellar basal body rod protein FlgB [candidate division KSB1 bacterium]
MILQRILAKTALPVLEKSLDAASLRQRVTAENLAHASTPGYRRQKVVFEEELGRALSQQAKVSALTHPAHLPVGRRRVEEVEAQIVEDRDPGNGTGVNNVDTERELADLAKSQIYYAYAARLVARSYATLRESIRGRTG